MYIREANSHVRMLQEEQNCRNKICKNKIKADLHVKSAYENFADKTTTFFGD